VVGPLYDLFGGRPATVWEVEDGRVWGKGFAVDVEVPPQRGRNDDYGYTLIAAVHSVSHFRYPHIPLVHANYIIGKPDGCEVCLEGHAYFTPYADPADINRLMAFNLACLTSWHPCREQGDILPVAWKQYLDELPQRDANWKRIRQCHDYPLELLGRDSDNVGLFEVASSREVTKSGEQILIVQAKLVKKLKGLQRFQLDSIQEVSVFDDAFPSGTQQLSDKFAPRSRWILLLEDWSSHGHQPALQVDLCGAIAAMQTNLDVIHRGIQLDYAASERETARY
jgi:hypothetical protein